METLWMYPILGPSGGWLPFWCCSCCLHMLGPESVVLWKPAPDGSPVRPLALCSVVCEQAARDAVPDQTWEKMRLSLFFAQSQRLTETHELVIDLFERLDLKRFTDVAVPHPFTKDSPE